MSHTGAHFLLSMPALMRLRRGLVPQEEEGSSETVSSCLEPHSTKQPAENRTLQGTVAASS